MEALAAAASVAGLISLANEIPKLIDTAISIWSAPEEAKQLSVTTDTLVMTLRKLEVFLKTDEARDMNMASDSALVVSLSACQNRVLELSKKLRSQSSTGSAAPAGTSAKDRVKTTIARFRWPFDKKECLAVISELHAMQNTFEFCLVLNNCQQMSKSHKEVVAHFKAQSDMLSQMASSFPDQAANTTSMLEKLRVIESCVTQSAEKIDLIQIGVAELQEMKKDLAEYYADKLHGQVLEWLSPIDPSTRHEEIKATRMPGTCEWILDNAWFRRWRQLSPLDDSPRVGCWVGDPGQGKTYTMSRVVDHLHASFSRGDKAYVTYLYCDYQRTRSYSATALLGALLRQLLSQFEAVPAQIADLVHYTCVKLRRSTARIDEMFQIIEMLKPHVKRLFVCVDALDECSDAENLVTACQKFSTAASFFFIGRQSIAQVVKRAFPVTTIQAMEPQQADIDAVVSSRIEKEKFRQPDLMPNGLASEIRAAISDLANGMFLLASLHTTLVLSHDTVYRRREALANLPRSLEGAFGQTLVRIREQSNAQQAFKIIAWIHLVGPLPLGRIRNILAVEPHHTHFQNDNLPSSTTVDSCLGLARLDTSHLVFDDSTEVRLVHSTLGVYLESNQSILADVLPTLVGTCFAYLSFDPTQRPADIHSLMNGSWVRILQACRNPPAALLEMAWKRCIFINTFMNAVSRSAYREGAWHDGKYSGILPKQAHTLQPKSEVPTAFAAQRLDGQSILHTACMLGLDGLDPFLYRLREYAAQTEGRLCTNRTDLLGMSPLGWALISESHFDRHKGLRGQPSPFDSFERNLWRAERLIKALSGLDANKPLWDLPALETVRVSGATYVNGRQVDYFSQYPFLFFLGNYAGLPAAVDRCIGLMQSHLKFNIWSTFRSSQTSRSSGLLENQTRHSWSILALSISELISFRKTIDDEFENDATSLSLRRYDTPAISPTEWPQDNASRSSWRPGSAGLSLSHGTTTVAALFEPGKDIPVVVVGSWRQQRVDNYRRTRQDIPAKFTEPLPSTECWSMTLPREAVLHVGAVADSVDMMIYALSVQQLDPNSLDHQNQSALHLALDSQSISAAAYLMGYPGINLTIRNCLGKTPLHIAARHGLTKFASTILDKSPIVINFQDRQGKTALHYAVQSGTRWMVNLLLRHNADVNMQDIDGNIPLHLAIIKRDAILCDTMLEPRSGAGFSVSNLQIAWKLAIEAGAGFIMTILRAIQTKAQPLLLTNNPEPASSALAALPEMKMLQVVLAADKTSSFTAEDLDFMLKLTNTTGPSSSTALILGAGNNWGYLPDPAGTIRSALVKGAHNVAAYLLRLFPIDLDHLGEGGESALHLAVVYDAPQVVSALLLSNVNITRPDPQGYTALHLTLVHKRLSILKMLLQTPNVGVDIVYPGSSATALILATTHHFAEAVELLLACPEAIEHVNHLDNSGRAALHYAVLKQNIAIVRLLLACPRVDAALPAGDGRTALAYAALCAGKDMVQLLLDTGRFGGAGRVRDSYGKTALDWARLNTCPEVAKILREAG